LHCFRYVFFAQPFSAVFAVFVTLRFGYSFRYATLHDLNSAALTPQRIIKPKQECRFHSLHSTTLRFLARTSLIRFTPFHFAHFSSTLAQPHKKTPLQRQKHTPALRFQRRQPQPPLRCTPLWLSASATLTPLADGSQASPSVSRQSTPLRSAALPSAFGRLKAALPALFSLRPHTAPDHPPLKNNVLRNIITAYRLIFLKITAVE
jgi:hypothetical protein